MDDESGLVIDDVHAIQPLAELDWQVSTLPWRQDLIPWDNFDAVIIRSTWDYPPRLNEFLDTLEKINEVTRMANPIRMVRWNLSKTYLRDMEAKGIGIVPTLWADDLDETSLQAGMERLATPELVIKPVVGASGVDAFRIAPSDTGPRRGKIIECFRNRPYMMQPLMRHVITEGEFSLFYFNGRFSHAILKKPTASEFRSQEEHGASIRAVRPGSRLLQRGHQALNSVEERPLYARIDFVRDDQDDFRVMEMELIEPSLYLRMHPEAPIRFAQALDDWFTSG